MDLCPKLDVDLNKTRKPERHKKFSPKQHQIFSPKLRELSIYSISKTTVMSIFSSYDNVKILGNITKLNFAK